MKRVALVYTFGNLKKEVTFLGGAERRINYIFSNIDNSNIDMEIVFDLRNNKESVLNLLRQYLNEETKITIIDSYSKVFLYLVKHKFDIVCYVDCALQTIPIIWGSMLGGSKRIMLIESSNRAYGVFKKGFPEKILMEINYRMSNQLDTLYPSSLPLLKKKYDNQKRQFSVTPCSLPRIERYSKMVPKKKYILFAGRLIENKNPELFTRAAIQCADQLREAGFVCLICGDGPLKEEIASIIDEAKCEDVISLKGYVNMEEVTPECLVFCSLQHTENYPSQSLLEAITAGCYCICTNSGDTNVIIKDEFGKLVKEDVNELAGALREVLSFDSEKWTEVYNAARNFGVDTFSVQNAVQHYEKLFLEF